MVLPQIIPLFGPFAISGLLAAAAAGLLLGALAAAAAVRRRPALQADVGAAAVPLLLGALLGGRLGNQLLAVDLRPGNPAGWLTVTATSVSFTGALAGAAIGAWLGLRHLPAARRWEAVDAIAPAASLAVAVGWLGMPAPSRLPPLGIGAGIDAVPLLALAGFAALAALLSWQWPRRDYPGQNAATFVVLSSALRFVLGFAEQAAPAMGPWSLTQVGDAAAAAAGLALAAWLSVRAARAG